MPVADEPDPEALRLYWHTQYERIAHLEGNRLQFSNFVTAASVVAIGINVSSNQASTWNSLVIASAIGAANIIAILYARRVGRLIAMHVARAREIADSYWPHVAAVHNSVPSPERSFRIGKDTAHLAMHGLLTASGILLAVVAAVG